MPSFKRPAAADLPAADAELHRKLAQCGSRIGLITAIDHLAEAGWLTPSVLKRCTAGTRQRLHNALREHASSETTYGTVVQRMAMPMDKLPFWDFVHPFALMQYLCTISVALWGLLKSIHTPGSIWNIIIYID